MADGLSLERIVGITSSGNSSLYSSTTKSNLAYIAGCVVVVYNPEDNKQKSFFKGTRPISCVAFCKNDRYLCAGERGHQPSILVWDTRSREVVHTLAGHTHGVSCIAFSPNGKYLVSAGFKHDRQLIVWNMTDGSVISKHKIGNKVNAIKFREDGKAFVTCGDRHLKWWYVEYDNKSSSGSISSIQGKAASILEAHSSANFVDLHCGSRSNNYDVYCITSSGVLCLFEGETRMMRNWVQLESVSSYCICFTKGMIDPDSDDKSFDLLYVGCSDGIICCFKPTLEYYATLPLPAPLPQNTSYDDENATVLFPACYGVCDIHTTDPDKPRLLAVLYADNSFFVWDISAQVSNYQSKCKYPGKNLLSETRDVMEEVVLYRSCMYHHSCIWDVHFADSVSTQPVRHSTSGKAMPKAFPSGSFVTCSADSTIRFWNLNAKAQRSSRWNSEYSNDMLHCLDVPTAVGAHKGGVLSSSINSTGNNGRDYMVLGNLNCSVPDMELPNRNQDSSSPRSLAVHPCGEHVSCGDKAGLLRVFCMRSMTLVHEVKAHDAEILTLCYSPVFQKVEDNRWTVMIEGVSALTNANCLVLLASAGRDRLIHIFDATIPVDSSEAMVYPLVTTLDNHSASVTVVKFTLDGNYFLSCGGDKTIVISQVHGKSFTRIRSVQTPHGTIHGLAIDATYKYAVTSGQDRRMNVWNVVTGKHIRAYKHPDVTGDLYKSDIDPSGTYVATCTFDKKICIFDFFSGELKAQELAHSDIITSVRFSPNGKHLLTVAGDGCIMVWRLGAVLVKNMQERIVELYANAKKIAHKESVTGAAVTPGYPVRSANKSAISPSSSQALLRASMKYGLQKEGAPVSAHDLPPPPDSEHIQHSHKNKPSVVPPLPPTSSEPNPSNQWNSRAAEGYELFGHKMSVDKGHDNLKLNKFTVELGQTDGFGTTPSSPLRNMLSPRSTSSSSSSHRLVGSIEEGDNVMLDENEDKKGSNPQRYDDDTFELEEGLSYEELEREEKRLFVESKYDENCKVERVDEEEDSKTRKKSRSSVASAGSGSVALEKSVIDKEEEEHRQQDSVAYKRLDSLEQSMSALENWLESKLRLDSTLTLNEVDDLTKAVEGKKDNPVGDDVRATVETGDPSVNQLRESMSSDFFKKRVSSGNHANSSLGDNSASSKNEHQEDREYSTSFVSKSAEVGNSDAVSVDRKKDTRRRETAAAVALMKDRLRVMGLLQSTSKTPVLSAEGLSAAIDVQALPMPPPMSKVIEEPALLSAISSNVSSTPITAPEEDIFQLSPNSTGNAVGGEEESPLGGTAKLQDIHLEDCQQQKVDDPLVMSGADADDSILEDTFVEEPEAATGPMAEPNNNREERSLSMGGEWIHKSESVHPNIPDIQLKSRREDDTVSVASVATTISERGDYDDEMGGLDVIASEKASVDTGMLKQGISGGGVEQSLHILTEEEEKEFKERSASCREAMSELASATQRAMTAYQSLMSLRDSKQFSVRSSAASLKSDYSNSTDPRVHMSQMTSLFPTSSGLGLPSTGQGHALPPHPMDRSVPLRHEVTPHPPAAAAGVDLSMLSTSTHQSYAHASVTLIEEELDNVLQGGETALLALANSIEHMFMAPEERTSTTNIAESRSVLHASEPSTVSPEVVAVGDGQGVSLLPPAASASSPTRQYTTSTATTATTGICMGPQHGNVPKSNSSLMMNTRKSAVPQLAPLAPLDRTLDSDDDSYVGYYDDALDSREASRVITDPKYPGYYDGSNDSKENTRRDIPGPAAVSDLHNMSVSTVYSTGISDSQWFDTSMADNNVLQSQHNSLKFESVSSSIPDLSIGSIDINPTGGHRSEGASASSPLHTSTAGTAVCTGDSSAGTGGVTSTSDGAASVGGSSTTGSWKLETITEDAELVQHILDKYSDRMVDMVSEKMMAKMNQTKSSSDVSDTDT